MTAYSIQRPDTAFAMSHGKSRRPRKEADSHLRWIRTLPCAVCGKRPVHAAHLRAAAPHFGKRATGAGEKPDDAWVCPLCSEHHLFGQEAQHSMNESEFWAKHGIDPFVLALALFRASGDDEAGEIILRTMRAI